MSRYHLQARAFEGPLAQPARDEVRLAESRDRPHLEAMGRALVDDGFTVWIFEHGERSLPGCSDLRMVLTLHPEPVGS